MCRRRGDGHHEFWVYEEKGMSILIALGGLVAAGTAAGIAFRKSIGDKLEHWGLKATPLQKVDALADDLASHSVKKAQQALNHRSAAEQADTDGRRAANLATVLGK
jgi:hypothetical protein